MQSLLPDNRRSFRERNTFFLLLIMGVLFIQFIAPPQQKPNIDNPVDNKNAAAKKDDASLTEEKKETTSEKPVGAVKEAASSDRPALSIRREL